MATFHLGLWPLFRAFLGGLVKGCLGLAEMQMFLMLWEGKTHGTKVWGRSWRRFWLSCSKKAGHSAFSPWLLGDAVFLSLLVYSHAGESGAWLWIWFASIAASAGPREICKGWLEDYRGPRNNQDTWQQMPKACTCLQWRSDWTIGRLSSEAEDSTHGCPHARSEGQPGGAANVDRSSLQEVPKNPPGRFLQFHHYPSDPLMSFLDLANPGTPLVGWDIRFFCDAVTWTSSLWIALLLKAPKVSSHRSFSQLEECFFKGRERHTLWWTCRNLRHLEIFTYILYSRIVCNVFI